MHTRQVLAGQPPDGSGLPTVSMLLLAALRGVPVQCGHSNFVANRNKAFRREDFCNSLTAQPLTRIPSRVQPSAADLVHKQRSRRPRLQLRVSSDQIEQSTSRVELGSLRLQLFVSFGFQESVSLPIWGSFHLLRFYKFFLIMLTST